MNEIEDKNKIAVLKCPKFWRVAEKNDKGQNSWTNSFKGRVYWGYLYNDDCELCKMNVRTIVNIGRYVNYILL